MPIDSTHMDYDKSTTDWKLIRDTVEGQTKIKGEGQLYLPAPPGSLILNTPVQVAPEGGVVGVQSRYAFYKSFAKFPEIVTPALNGMQGIIHTKDPEITLPSKMEYLLEEATPDGKTLINLWEDITREILQTGRLGLLVELFGDSPVLCRYEAETLINWKVRPKRFGGQPEFIVLTEKIWLVDPKDEFAPALITRYRILRFDGTNYTVQAFDKINDEFVPVELEGTDPATGRVTPVLMGKAFGFMPFTVVNAVMEGFSIGPMPFLPLSRRALNIYQKSATFERSLYLKGDPTVVITGIDPKKSPTTIGGGSAWVFPDPETKVTMLDIDGDGIPLQRDSIKDEYEYFYQEGGRLLDTRDRSVESGKALERREINHNVSLIAIAVNGAGGMQNALRQIAVLLNVDPEEVEFNANLDFTLPTMSGKELVEFTKAKNQGAPISNETIHEMMKRRNITTKSFEEEQAAIDEEPEDMGGFGRAVPQLGSTGDQDGPGNTSGTGDPAEGGGDNE